jgi:hypothetical protein
MRELKSSDKNVLNLNDAMGGGQVALYYRTPTTAERVAFQKNQIERKGNQIISRTVEARLASGLAILTGIRTGDFSYDGVPLSSTPGEEGYRPDWKKLVEQTAADLVLILGQTIFEGEQKMPAGMAIQFVDNDAAEPAAGEPEAAEPAAAPEGAEGSKGEEAPLASLQTSAV